MFFFRPVIAADPFCLPVARKKQPHLKERSAPLSRFILFIPEAHFPVDSLPAAGMGSAVGDVGAGRGTYLPAVPYLLAVLFRDDLIGALGHAALTFPVEPGVGFPSPTGSFQIICPHMYCSHIPSFLSLFSTFH